MIQVDVANALIRCHWGKTMMSESPNRLNSSRCQHSDFDLPVCPRRTVLVQVQPPSQKPAWKSAIDT